MNRDTSARSAEDLRVPVDATREAATRAFLTGLQKADFLPTTESVASLNTLAGTSLPCDLEESISLLQDEVKDFEGRYWWLAPEERSRAWARLRDRAPGGAISRRLAWLEIGLTLPGMPLSEEALERTAAIARELYLLTERKRAIRRNEWLLANAPAFAKSVYEAELLRERYPQFAGLDPVLFSRLMPDFKVAIFSAAAGAEPIAELPVEQPDSIAYKPIEFTMPVQASHIDAQKSIPGARKRFLDACERHVDLIAIKFAEHVYIYVVAFAMLIAFFKIIFSSSSGSKPVPSPSRPPLHSGYEVRSPINPSSRIPDYLPHFTPEQVKQCEEYEKSPNANPRPSHYFNWVIAGKPSPYDHTSELETKRSEATPSQQVQAPFSLRDIRLYRLYEQGTIGYKPEGYESWVQSGRPSKAP